MRGFLLGTGGIFLLVGFVCGVVALATLRRYGRNGILRQAIIGLCLNLALLLLLSFFVMVVLSGLTGAVR